MATRQRLGRATGLSPGCIMPSDDGSKTSPTLLGRLAQFPLDQEAWSAFVDRYAPRFARWCRHWGLQDADVENVSQGVLTKLVVRMRGFVYDPSMSFRGYLRKIVFDALTDELRQRRLNVTASAGDLQEVLESVEARVDLVQRLEQEFDLELVEAASRAVRQRIDPHTWEAYRLTTGERLSGAEAAARLGIEVATVYVAKGRVIQMLKDEIRSLETPVSSVGTG
jgi:RNA polymerase sigma factor (sigma-70 family)